MAKKSSPRTGKPSQSEEIRLNKFIANAGVCSRREADQLIAKGEIKVNGQVVTELGFKVKRSDKVEHKGRKLFPEKKVYVLLNKPRNFITTTDDPENRKTVMDLVKKAADERLYPVGRLDRHTTGLLLLTNDGELAQKLAHPSFQIKKIYQVELDKDITKDHLAQIAEGITLDDGPVKVNKIALLDAPNKLGVEVHIGRNRIVRRVFEYFGYEVMKLDRVLYAGLDKLNLPRGKWRYLTDQEIQRLRNIR